MNEFEIVSCADGCGCLQHKRNRACWNERRFTRQKIAQRLAFEQLHDDVKPAIVGGAKIINCYGVGMMHASGRPRFATKALLCSFVTDEALTENFYSDGSLDQEMCCAINGAHSAATEDFVQSVFTVERSTN